MTPTYDKRHIADVMAKSGINRRIVCFMDDRYVYLDDAAAGTFFSALATQVIDTFKGWQSQFRDCDKFSRLVQALAQVAHATQWSSKNSAPAGLALGVFNYVRKKGGGHSINCMVTKVDGQNAFALRFFEPQTGKEVTLSPEEIKSAFLVLL